MRDTLFCSNSFGRKTIFAINLSLFCLDFLFALICPTHSMFALRIWMNGEFSEKLSSHIFSTSLRVNISSCLD
jgi:hypothetical protein